MKKFRKLVTAIAVSTGLTFGSMALAAPAANADEPTLTPVVNITISEAATAELKVNAVTTLDTDANGKVMMAALKDYQLTDKDRRARAIHWLLADAKKCPTVANQPTTQAGIKAIGKTSFVKKGAALKRFKTAVPSAKITKRFADGRQRMTVRCFWVKPGGTFTDTGVNPNGKTLGMKNVVGGPGTLKGRPMLFDTAVMAVKSGNTVVNKEVPRRRGQNVSGSKVVGYGDCLNPKANVVNLLPGSFVYAWAWSAFRQHVEGTVHQRLRVAGKGRVERGGCFVEFEYDFLTEGSLAFDQTIWAKTKAEALGKAGTAATSTDISSNTVVTGSIKNTLEANLRVAFGEQCDGTPPTFESPTVNVAPIACVEPGQSRNVAVTVSNPNGTSDTVHLTLAGQAQQADKPIAAHGQVTYTFLNVGAGTYSGTALLVSANKSKSFPVTVEECPPVVHEEPTIDLTVEACVPGATALDVTAVVGNPNPGPSAGTVKIGSTTKSFGSIAAGGSSAPITFPDLAPGTYTVTATLTAFGTTTSREVTVPVCPKPTMVLSIEQMNDIDQSEVPDSGPILWSWTDLKAHAVAPTGAGNVSYTVDSLYGSVKFLENNTKNLTKASGTYDIGLRYTAPTEVPTRACSDGNGKCDVITITAVFAGTTYSAHTEIRINPTPTIPL